MPITWVDSAPYGRRSDEPVFLIEEIDIARQAGSGYPSEGRVQALGVGAPSLEQGICLWTCDSTR
jgi:hypothetical protein